MYIMYIAMVTSYTDYLTKMANTIKNGIQIW